MGIQVFEHENFGGEHETFTDGFFNLSDNDVYPFGNIRDNMLTSFILDPYSQVTFYWDSNGQGQQYHWENNSSDPLRVSNIGSEWNDAVSSMVVGALAPPQPPSLGENSPPPTLDVIAGLKGCRFFEDWQYNEQSPRPAFAFMGPRAQVFPEGQYNLPHEPELLWRGLSRGKQMGVRPNAISSVQVGAGYIAELFEGPNLTGERLTVEQSTRDIRTVGGDKWNDHAQSLRIYRRPVPR